MFYADHPKGDSITAVATSSDNNYILTGDTAGQLKLWNFSVFEFKKDLTMERVKV